MPQFTEDDQRDMYCWIKYYLDYFNSWWTASSESPLFFHTLLASGNWSILRFSRPQHLTLNFLLSRPRQKETAFNFGVDLSWWLSYLMTSRLLAINISLYYSKFEHCNSLTKNWIMGEKLQISLVNIALNALLQIL